MLQKMSQYFTRVPSAYVDGALYVAMGATGFLLVYFGGDDAAKYISPAALFFTKGVIGLIDAMLLSLKLFRSTAFSDHKEEVKANTTIITK